MREYSTTELCKVLKIKKPRIQELIYRGFITPKKIAQGKDGNVFRLIDIYIVALFLNLIKNRNFSRALAGKMVKKWGLPYDFKKIKYIAFFFEGEKIIPANHYSEEQLTKILAKVKSWDSVHIINFDELKKKVDSNLSKLEKSN